MTARTNLQVQLDQLILEQEEPPRHFYDIEENFWQLREELGDMPDPTHNLLVDCLLQILRFFYRLNRFVVEREIKIYGTGQYKEKPLYPDVFVLKSRQELTEGSYQIGVDGPAPEIVIEVISKNKPSNDLIKKPPRYEAWGIAEYFAYDPRERKIESHAPRLYGWRLVEGKYEQLKADSAGRMWSEQLDSWLVPDGEMLRLFDRDGNQRLTDAEAAHQAKEVERQAKETERQAKEAALQREAVALQQLETERNAKEVEQRAKETERHAKEAALRQAEVERQAKEAVQLELEKMAESLRQLKDKQDQS